MRKYIKKNVIIKITLFYTVYIKVSRYIWLSFTCKLIDIFVFIEAFSK